jgi:CBS domain-containing protein
MEEFVTTLTPDSDIHSAMDTLFKKKLPGAPVLDADGKLVGILSEKDCLRIVTAVAFERTPEGKVSDYMTRDVVSVTPQTTVFGVIDRFLTSHFRRLPVVDPGGRLLGVVNRPDVVKAIAAMRASASLYPNPDRYSIDKDDTGGVDSAMRRAREQ